MAVRLTWLPNPEADIASYDIQRSDDAVNFTTIASITHDLGDTAVYDSATGRFYYEDATGIADTHYYRIRAIDSATNQSAWTSAKQAGPPSPPVCTLFGTVVDADGSPNTNVVIRVTITSAKATKDGQLVGNLGVTSNQIEAFTDDAGFFEVTILQGACVNLEIPSIELEQEVTVPAQASVDFQELL